MFDIALDFKISAVIHSMKNIIIDSKIRLDNKYVIYL